MPKLSVIILSYNTNELTKHCLDSLSLSLRQASFESEIIVIDNASSDGSVLMLREYQLLSQKNGLSFTLIENTHNGGFSKGNNQGLQKAKGEYVLLLNSDVIIRRVDFDRLIEHAASLQKFGGLTVRVVLPNGKIDPASHRGFPTPWNSLTYFAKLERFFGTIPGINRLVGGYHLTYLNLQTEHEIDAPAAAFYLTTKDVVNQVGGFDEDFFMYGEDIDLTYRIKEKGYKIFYYPAYEVLHYKRSSGLDQSNQERKKRIKKHFFEAMKIFYQKHYQTMYPRWITQLIYAFIDWKLKQT